MRIGFVGLGNMGTPMVQALASAGHEIVAFDLSAERRAGLDGVRGVVTTGSVSLASATEALILMLPDGNVARRVLIGSGNAVAYIPKNGLVIDMSSSDPFVYEEISSELAVRGISLVDAPVSGNVDGAKAGSLTIMAGGDGRAIDRATPLFDAMGKTTFRTGPLGSGQAMKALNNLLSAGGLIMAIEMLLVAKKCGLDPTQVNAILNVSTGRNNSTNRKIEPFVLNGAYNSGFGLSLMAKDLRTAAAIADRNGVEMPLAHHAVEIANAAEKTLGEGTDHTEIARWLEKKAGLRLS